MRILSLNVWHGGHLKEAITAFMRDHAVLYDVLCFQEMYPSIRGIVDEFLIDFIEIREEKTTPEDNFIQSIFLRKDIVLIESGAVLKDVPCTGLGLWVSFSQKGKEYMVMNYHGKSQPGYKTDNPDRLHASSEIIAFNKTRKEQCIVVGDFNLLETTRSVGIFEEAGYRNLIKDFNIYTTRNHYIWDQFPHNIQLHSNYVFVEEGIEVINFEILPDIVSDHQPLALEVT